LTIELEKKEQNRNLKSKLLRNLQQSIEDLLLQDRELPFKTALNDAIERTIAVVPERIVSFGGRNFDSPRRWVICFLGSLRNVCNFDGVANDPSINIIIVVITEEEIEQD